MAEGRSERREQAARELRNRLIEEGRHQDALVIDDVLRTLVSTRSTLRTIHHDNMKLRRLMALPSFRD